MSDDRIILDGHGPVEVVTRAELDAHTCNCGEPGCKADSVHMRTDASPYVEAVYYKAHGAVVFFCSCCGKAHRALRVM